MTDAANPNLPPSPPRSGSEPVPLRAAEVALPPHPLDKRWYAHVDG